MIWAVKRFVIFNPKVFWIMNNLTAQIWRSIQCVLFLTVAGPLSSCQICNNIVEITNLSWRGSTINLFLFVCLTVVHTLLLWVLIEDSVAKPLSQIAQWKGRFFSLSDWDTWLRKCCCKFDNWIKALPQSGTWHLYIRSPEK